MGLGGGGSVGGREARAGGRTANELQPAVYAR